MDREKVIHAVETAFELWIDEYTGCSWFKEDEVRQAKEDAIAMLKEQEHKDRMFHALEDDWKRLKELLKEQEAVEPTLIREGRNKYYNDYVCPRCDNEVVYEQNYCSECGVRFLWEGR